MKSILTFVMMLVLLSACSEKSISPEELTPKMNVEDDPQPPKSNCSGGQHCG